MKSSKKDKAWGYVMLLPAIIIFLGFMVYPLIYGFYISLNQWDGFGPMKFIGFQNYVDIFKDKLFITSLTHNLEYAVVTTVGKIVLSLLLASLLNSKIKGITVFRTIYFIPVVISFIAIGLMFQLMLDPNVGLVNGLLMKMGIINAPIQFLADTKLALPTIMAIDIWKWVGYQTVIFLAGLQTISPDLYEAADIDGANSWKKFIFVTVPQLRSVMVINVTLCVMGGFSVFDLPFVMTNGSGGPLNSTHVLMTYMYKITFGGSNSNMGFGSAVAFIVLFIVLIVSIIQSKYSSVED